MIVFLTVYHICFFFFYKLLTYFLKWSSLRNLALYIQNIEHIDLFPTPSPPFPVIVFHLLSLSEWNMKSQIEPPLPGM